MSTPLVAHLTFRNDEDANADFFRKAFDDLRKGLARKGPAYPLRRDANGDPIFSRLRGGVAYRFRSDRLVDCAPVKARYLCQRENGDKRGRFHAHLVLCTDRADFEPGRVALLWPHGRCKVSPLVPKDGTFQAVGQYLAKYLTDDANPHRKMQSQGYGFDWNTHGRLERL